MIKYHDYLTGDTEIPKSAPLMHRARFKRLRIRLAKAARHHGEVWHINSGYRTYAEQVVLYEKYLHHNGNLAAKPGTSNHGRGAAADVSAPDKTPVGENVNRRKTLKKLGLCLPVKGEKWHVEIGNKWRA